MEYIVYQTINLVNNKIYIGVHKTENSLIFDGYYGGGINIKDNSKLKHPLTPFHYALKKYGFSNFKRSTIKVFDTYKLALDLEKELVNEEFVLRLDTYNITIGGGMPPINCVPIYQYDLDGNFLYEYESILEAGKILNLDDSAIGYAYKNKTTSGEFLWSINKVSKLDITEYTHTLLRKEVYLYNIDGEYEMTIESVSACARFLQVTYAPVQRAYLVGGKIKDYYLYYKKLDFFIPEKIILTGKINLFTLDGEYIKSYDSIKEVEQEFGCSMKGINPSIKMGNSYKNFIWTRGKSLNKTKPYNKKPLTRKVGQYDLDGNLVKVFNTVREARSLFSNVNKVLKGTAKQCKGYSFKYIE